MSSQEPRFVSSNCCTLQLVVVLAFMALLGSLQHAAAVSTLPLVQTDHTMGIRTYSFLIAAPELNSTAYELRVYVRATCDSNGNKVLLRGFAGAFPIEGSAPSGLSLFAPHFQPPSLHQHQLQVFSTAANRTTILKWFGPSNQGLWRFEGRVEPSGGELLTLEGSLHTHQLPLDCTGSSSVALGPAQHTPLPSEGLWNVVTTTSANKMIPEMLAHLLTLHMQYHERLGFNGTILRCNKGEAQELSVLPHIEALVASSKLIVWPWVHEHSIGNSPFFWQKPRNQLTLLAAYGTKVKLTFFDLDEYLVLPQGGTVSNSSCLGKPLLDPAFPAFSFVRYSVRSCGKHTDLACWVEGQALPTATGLDLTLEKCPCQFHKPLVEAERTLTLSVHYVWAWGAKIHDVPENCGFLMHLHALVHRRNHFMPPGLERDHLMHAKWVLPEAGSGQIMVDGSADIGVQLHNFTYCGELRKVAAKKHGKAKFSVC